MSNTIERVRLAEEIAARPYTITSYGDEPWSLLKTAQRLAALVLEDAKPAPEGADAAPRDGESVAAWTERTDRYGLLDA